MERYPEALASYQSALTIDEKTLGPEHPDLGEELTGIGLIHLNLGAAAAAVPFLERALRLRRKAPENHAELGETSFALARSIQGAGDKHRARRLAEEAVAQFQEEGPPGAAALAEVSQWLAKLP